MNLLEKKIGIWGFGVTGKSVLTFLYKKQARIQVMDNRPLTAHELTLLQEKSIPYISQKNIEQFLNTSDFIIASPGIDLRPYRPFKKKFITELDLFSQFFTKPTIAITGTVGKTTITSLLTHILSENRLSVVTGGNIGTGLCDLISQTDAVDYAVLEVSSFQLEYCKQFAPAFALWTNFYPNHLDRHTTLTDYFNAKMHIIVHQKKGQQALLPLTLAAQLPKTIQSTVSFFTTENITTTTIQKQYHDHRIFWIKKNAFVLSYHGKTTELYNIDQLPEDTFIENWLCIIATLSLLKIPLTATLPAHKSLEHRLEHVATINDVVYYNDSKATVPQATLASVNKLANKHLILFLGGLSKGVDRTALIAALKNKVQFVFCFGIEAHQLQKLCQQNNIDSEQFTSLDDAFTACVKMTKPGNTVLFSPSGSSFDLFRNYQERGNRFKELVKELE